MSILSNKIIKTALYTAVIGLAASCANAEQFKLTLPVEAQWGRALLPAGQYTVTTDQISGRVLHVSGNGKSVSVIVATSAPNENYSASTLSLVNVNGTPVIQGLTNVGANMTYTFLIPPAKAVHSSTSRTVAFTLRDQPAKQ